jgi:EmrB/QacA subfamily drug resistance transporter
MTTNAGPDRATAAAAPAGHGWRAVSIVLVGAFMALLDTTIVNVALPSIRTGLHASSSSLEWIVAGYALAYGLALVPAGRAGDRFGHKPLFLVGLTIFTLASVACGLSQSPAEIVTARVAAGFGAGVFYPAISATIQLSFTGPQRSKAFGVLGATIGVSTALGPLLGGLIIAGAGVTDGWRWVFLVNLFIGAVTVPLAAWQLPRSAAHARRGFDPAGLALLTAALLLLLIPLVEGQQVGWPAWCWACFGGCAVAIAALAAWEVSAGRRGGDPLLKPALLRQMSFSAGAIFAVVYFAGFASVFFTLSILWQEGLGHSALITGLVIAPFSLGSLIAAARSDRLSARLGRMVLVTGCVLVIAGLGFAVLVVHLTAPEVSGWYLVAPLFVAGLGNGMTIAPNQDFVLASVPRREAGTASGILGTAQRVGTALGIAIIGTVLFGTLAVKPGPDAVAVAFSHSAELALLANVGFVTAALILVVALPRRIPDPGSRGLGSAVPGQAPSVRRPWSDRGRGGAAGVPDRLAQVAAGDHGDELVDRVLLGGQRARDGVR